MITIMLSLPLLNSCKLTDDKETKAKDYLQKKVTTESKGALNLDSFKKTNGYDQNMMGEEIYVLEWEAEISALQEIWKSQDTEDGTWINFGVSNKKSNFDWMVKHIELGAKIHATGECEFRKTENGWLVESCSIKSTKEVSGKL